MVEIAYDIKQQESFSYIVVHYTQLLQTKTPESKL